LLVLVLRTLGRLWRIQSQDPVEAIPEILHPNFHASPHKPDGSNQGAAHRGHLTAEDTFDVGSNTRAVPVMCLLLSGQGFMAIPFAVDLEAQSGGFEVGLDPLGPVGRVGPDIASGHGIQQDGRQNLTIMHRRIGDPILPNQLVHLIQVQMVFGPVTILALYHRPTSLRVFLPSLSRVTVPRRWALPGFEGGVFLMGIALLEHGDQ
jgi:hypothetical protein